MARVLVIDDDAGLLQMVKLMLEREGHIPLLAEGGELGIQAALTQSPDLAIIDLMMPGISGYDVTRQLRSNPQTAQMPIMILTARSQPMDKQMALNAGATAYMSKPVSSRDLIARLDEILENHAAGGQSSNSTGRISQVPTQPQSAQPASPSPGIRRLPIGADPTAAGPVQIPRGAVPRINLPEKQLPLIAVLALRSGSGGSTLAINLAFTLRRNIERVCLVDMSMAGGSIGLYLHLNTRGSWADLIPLGDRFDARAVGSTITPHPQQGIGVIGAPPAPPAQPLSPEAALTLFTTLTAGFQSIVVDVSSLNPASIAALAVARTVLVVVSDDMASVQSNTNLTQTLAPLNIDPKKVRIVINHNRPEPGVPTATIAKAIGSPLSAELPYDVNQLQAIRRGVPTVVLAPESAYSLALQQLSRIL